MHSELPCVEFLASNFTRVHVGPVVVWFSYRTPVAFLIGGERVVRQNEWSTTTGKHLNQIDGGDKASRVDGATFRRLWNEKVGSLFTVTV